VVEDGWEADAVKVLGDGQVRNQLEVTADAFSASAVELIEEEGGDAVLSDRAEEAEEEAEEADEESDVEE
jgi:large subunit ribosomal protein L15